MKIKVGVFFGGQSVEHEISVISALQTIQAIDSNKYEAIPIYISKKGNWFTGDVLLNIDKYKNMEALLGEATPIHLTATNNHHNLLALKKSWFKNTKLGSIDVAFPVFHGTFGEDGAVQGLFELMGIPYVGCNVLSSSVGMDKILFKMILKEAGLPVVNYYWCYFKEWQIEEAKHLKQIEQQLEYPLIVKPANLGSSVGIKRANNREQLVEAINYAGEFTHRILVEKAISQLQEINCAVIGTYDEMESSVCEEPISSGEILSYQDKYVSKTGGNSKGMRSAKRKLPANIPAVQSQHIQLLAKQTFRVLGASGVVRIDFLIDKAADQIYINEINTIPGSLSFYLWEAGGKSYTALTEQLIKIAFKNYRRKNKLNFSYDTNIFNVSNGGFKLK